MRYPDRVKPGEAVKADTINALIDVVRALELRPGRGYGVSINSGGTTMDLREGARGVEGGGCALVPRFGRNGDDLVVSFGQERIMVPVGVDGAYAEVVPKFADSPIVSDGSGWVKPTRTLSESGEHFVWLKVQGAYAALVVGKEDEKPDYQASQAIYKLAKFDVESGAGGKMFAKNREMYHCPQFIAEDPNKHEGYPVVYNAGDSEEPDWKVRFSPVYCCDGESGESKKASNNDEEQGVESADKFYLHWETDEDGVVTNFEIAKAESPTNTPFLKVNNQVGDYYLELCEIKEANDGSLYAEIKRSAGVYWHPNKDYAVNAEGQAVGAVGAPDEGQVTDGSAAVLKVTNQYPYTFRILKKSDQVISNDVGVNMEWEQGATSVKPKLTPHGATGSLSLTICEGGGTFALEVVDGMIQSITSGHLEAAPCADEGYETVAP